MTQLSPVELFKLQLIQARDSPHQISLDLWGFYESTEIQKFRLLEGELLLEGQTIQMAPFVELKAEHIDIGFESVAVMSPVNCDCSLPGDKIESASVHFYSLNSLKQQECWDIDTRYLSETGSEAWRI